MERTTLRGFVAAGFGAGWIPRRIWGSDNGAGTVGAVLAALISVALAPLPVTAHVMAAVIATWLSLWAPRPYLDGDGDPQWVAIDEVAGTLVALTGLAGIGWLVAWLVFRAADIWKVVPGVRQAERLPGALGVTADDLVAGIYGLVAGWLVTLI